VVARPCEHPHPARRLSSYCRVFEFSYDSDNVQNRQCTASGSRSYSPCSARLIASCARFALPADLERQHQAQKLMSSQMSGVKAMHHNVPPKRRLSREATVVVSPVALTHERTEARDNTRNSIVLM
jgi:hypothetical protein